MDILLEQIKTIKNLAETALFLKELGREQLLPTILELMFVEIQTLNDDYCVRRDENAN